MKNPLFVRSLGSVMVLACSLLALSACGEGGGGPASPVSFQGTTALGAPFANATVTFTCRAGTASTTSDTNGNFSLTALVQTPCVVAATNGALTLHSLAPGPGVINVTPLTELLTLYVVGQLNTSESALLSNFSGNTHAQALLSNSAQVSQAQSAVATLISTTYHIKISTTNFLGTPFVAGSGAGADADLDVLGKTGAIDPSTGAPSTDATSATLSLGQSNPFNPGGPTGATGGTGGAGTGG
ncbi:MAG: hypothetical protein QOI13_3305 [Paraburkholderia sp.]|jgi:hypothetical protein|nr:hypothetical protein [Paraburkholderia sp.]